MAPNSLFKVDIKFNDLIITFLYITDHIILNNHRSFIIP